MERILTTLCDGDILVYHIITDGNTVWRKYPDGTTKPCGPEDFDALAAFGLWYNEEVEK